jgi:flagellar biosynthesis protein FlhG
MPERVMMATPSSFSRPDASLMPPSFYSSTTAPQVIGIASGKGGAGKTTVSVNLAVALAQRGHRVMLLDADLGMANAQIALGVNTPWNISHVLHGHKSLADIVVRTPQGVHLIPGASGLRDIAALDVPHIAAIVRLLDTLQTPIDYLIVDVAAGIAPPVLTFLGACQRRFVVLYDQPASIADAYSLIKVMVKEQHLDEIHLISNMVATPLEGELLFRHMNDVSTRFLGHSLRYLGAIQHDDQVIAAQRKYQSILEFSPGSRSAADFRRLATAVEDLPPIERTPSGLQFFMQRMV